MNVESLITFVHDIVDKLDFNGTTVRNLEMV